jgi:hypothetical protein
MRKHTALKLDAFQTLLGSCRSQLFVSLAGLLPLLLARQCGSERPDAGWLAGGVHGAAVLRVGGSGGRPSPVAGASAKGPGMAMGASAPAAQVSCKGGSLTLRCFLPCRLL